MMASCGTRTKKTEAKPNETNPVKTAQVKTASAEETAHAHGCMTMEEFVSMRYTYVIEKELPCRVYVDKFMVNDIVSSVKEKKYDPKTDITLYNSIYQDGDWSEIEDSSVEFGFGALPDWVGKSTYRQNECWVEGTFGIPPLFGVSGYLGIDKSQSEWMVKKAMESGTIGIVNIPIIIRVDQVRKDGGISIKADLVAILNED